MKLRIVTTSVLGMAAVVALAKPPAAKAPPPIPMTTQKAGHQNLPRHAGDYAPLQVRWLSNDRVSDVLAVFPHPVVQSEVYLATASGLLKSTDAGESYQPLPQASADKTGRVTAVAIAPNNARKLVIATADHGLQLSTDAGQTLTPLAGKSTGLVADAVRNVYFPPDDPFHRSLLAIHGEDAPGLSRSIDAGKTWQAYYPDKHIYGIYFTGGTDGKEMLFDAAPADDPAARSLYFTPSITEGWQKLIDDVVVTGSAPVSARGSTIYLATAAKGLYRIARQGGVIRQVGPADINEWSSFGWTFDSTADAPLFFGYHGKKAGMVTFTPKQLEPSANGSNEDADAQEGAMARTTHYGTHSDGLFTGPLVLEGSHIRPASGGGRFYAVINRVLYQTVPTSPGPLITSVTVTPADALIDPGRMKAIDAALLADLKGFAAGHRVAEAAAKLKPSLDAHLKAIADKRVSVKATVRTVPTDPATSVTVDLSRLGLSSYAPLFDDGQHDDGAAGDGVYANRFAPDWLNLQPSREDWRESWPGTIRLTVSALTRSGALAGGVGSMTLFRRTESIPFVEDIGPAKRLGNVAGSIGRSRDYSQRFKIISIRSAGEWGVAMGHWRDTVDISAQEALVFYLRSSAPTDGEITLQLRDAPTYTRPAETPAVRLKAEGFLEAGKVTPSEQRVVIPVSRLLKDAGDYQAAVTSALILGGTVDKPVDLMIRNVRFVPTLEQEEESP